MNAFDVYTIGGIEYISQVLEAIVLIFGNSTYKSMLMVSLLWGLIVAVVIGITRQKLYPISFLAFTFFIFHIFFTAKYDVLITDTKSGQQYYVADVPFGVALLTTMFSQASYFMTDMIDTAFHTGTATVLGANNEYVEAWDFKNNGFAGVFKTIATTKKISFDNPETSFKESSIIVAYFTDCLYPDMAGWTNDEKQTFFNSGDIFGNGLLRTKTNILINYEGNTYGCQEFYDNKVKKAIEDFYNLYQSHPELLGIIAPSAVSHMQSVVGAVIEGASFNTIVTQSAIKNAFETYWKEYASKNENLKDDVIMSYMQGIAEGKAKIAGKAIGEYAAEVIPLLNIAMQFLIIGIMPMIAIAILIPGGLSIIKNLIYTIAWSYLWFPVMALLDAIGKISYIASLKTSVDLNNKVFSIINANTLQSEAEWMAAISGFLAISTPGIAWMVLKGSDYTISSLGSRLGGYMQQQADVSVIQREVGAVEAGMRVAGVTGMTLAESVGRVKDAMDGNVGSMLSGFAKHTAGVQVGGEYLKSAMWNEFSGAGKGVKLYDTFGGSAGAFNMGAAAADVNFMQEKMKFMAVGFDKQFKEAIDNQYQNLQKEAFQKFDSFTHDASSHYQAWDKFLERTYNKRDFLDKYDKEHGTRFSEAVETREEIKDAFKQAFNYTDDEAAMAADKLMASVKGDGKFLDKDKFKKLLASITGNKEITDEQINTFRKTITDERAKDLTSGEALRNLKELTEKAGKDESLTKGLGLSKEGDEGIGYDFKEGYQTVENLQSSLDKAKQYTETLSQQWSKSAGFQQKLTDMLVDWTVAKAHDGDMPQLKGIQTRADAVEYLASIRGTEQLNALVSEFLNEKFQMDLSALEGREQAFMNNYNNMVNYERDSQAIRNEGYAQVSNWAKDSHEIIDRNKGQYGIETGQANWYLNHYGEKVKGFYEKQMGEFEQQYLNTYNEMNGNKNNLLQNFSNHSAEVMQNIDSSLYGRFGKHFLDNKEVATAAGINALMQLSDFYKNRKNGGMHMTTVPNTGGNVDLDKNNESDRARNERVVHGGRTPQGLEPPHTTERSFASKAGNVLKTGGKALGGLALGVVESPAVVAAGVAYAGYEVGTAINNAYGDWIYKHITNPVLNKVDELTGGAITGREYEQVRQFQSNMYKNFGR